MLLRTITLGCKVNQYETEYLREGLARLGYCDAQVDQRADLCLVNTCSVTVEGEAKSRKLIRHLARHNPGAEIVVMGCYASRSPGEVAGLSGVAEVIADKRQLPEWLARRGLLDVPEGISTFGRRHRAYVKIQDGCRAGCSYCIIPRVRPVLWSRPADDVLAEIGRLAGHGHREIVLTGIHLGHYGRDRQDGWDLARLVRQIARLEGEFRLRLSSLEAGEATHELIAAMAGHAERICPHLHIPLQSGSDAVLRRMGRRWPTGRLVRRCRRIQAALDQPALTTDVMVGFPGETEEDFAATCRAVEAVGFSKLHVFRFSPRPGTPAARMPNRVPDEVQQRRAAELARLGQQLRQRYFEGLAGRTLQVLVEREKGEKSNFSQPPGDFLAQVGPLPPLSPVAAGLLLGTADRYAPVELAGQRALVGRLVRVVAGPVVGGSVRATAV